MDWPLFYLSTYNLFVDYFRRFAFLSSVFMEKQNNIFCRNLIQSREKCFRNIHQIVPFGGSFETTLRDAECKNYAFAGKSCSRMTKTAEKRLREFSIFQPQRWATELQKLRYLTLIAQRLRCNCKETGS